MSLFIRLDCSFFRHRKTLRLRALIGDAALWVPPALWAYAAEHQPDGNMAEFTAKELALAIGYMGDAPSMLQALLQASFLDADMKIHDWSQHNGYHALHKEKARNAAKARWEKERTKEKGTEEEIRREERRSAPSIAPSIPQASTSLAPISELRGRLNALYKREPQASWGNDDEHYLVDVCKREHVLTELGEVEAFFKTGDYLPQKLATLLSGWTGVLDRARNAGRANGNGNGSGRPATIMDLKSIVSVKEEKAKALWDKYAFESGLSVDWSNETKHKEWSAIRTEIKGLKERIEKMA